MSKFGAFRSPRLLLCRHCIYVSYLLFRCSRDGVMCVIFPYPLVKKLVLQVSTAKFF